VNDDALGEAQTTKLSQRSITVRHEDLLVGVDALDSPTPLQEVLLRSSTLTGVSHCTNLSGQYT
jgi:hypothetical protein